MADSEVLSGISQVRRNWGWFLVLGIVLIVLGTIGLGMSVFLTLASVLLFGFLLLGSGIVHGVQAFWARGWEGFFLHVLAAVLSLIAGLFIVAHPGEAALDLTLLLAALLIVGGLFRTVGAVALQYPNWGFAVLGGVIAVVLGILLWRQWPASGVWFIGFCVALDMLFNGWSWVMFALAIRPGPQQPGGPAADRPAGA